MADKIEALLATLRGETPEPEPEVPAEGPPPMLEAPPIANVDLSPIEGRLAELESKIAELSAPPALDVPPPLNEPIAQPPEPPTQLTLFLQTRMELLERKLEMSQRDAVRANMILREREDAQRKAQKEIEDLFRGIREQQRSAGFDRELRKNYNDAKRRLAEMERRLSLSQLRMIPAEDVLRVLEKENGQAELERRIRIQLAKAEAASPADSSQRAGRAEAEDSSEGEVGPPMPPTQQMQTAPISGDIESISVLLGRIADLESRLEESEKKRESEHQSRAAWERQILDSMQTSRRQWQKAGGPELLVEAALESMVDSMQERDRLQLEMGKMVSMLQDEPPDSERTAPMRARLAEYQSKMGELQEKLGKQMSLVDAWVKRGRGAES